MKNLIILTIGLMISTTAFAELGEDTTRRENTTVKELPKDVKATHYTYANLFMYHKNSPEHFSTGMNDWTPFAGSDIIEGEDWITISNPGYIAYDETHVSILVDGDSKVSSKILDGSICTCYSTKSINNNTITESDSTFYCEKDDGTPVLYFSMSGTKGIYPVYYTLSNER